jgi:2-methylaconitate cis-trans-isomerase PrpF
MRLLAFIKKSFLDPRGTPDGKLLTLGSLTAMVLLQFPVYWIWKVAVPDYIWIPVVAMVAAAYGFSANENKAAIQADAQVAQAEATGQAAPAPTSATTTTTTTLTPE